MTCFIKCVLTTLLIWVFPLHAQVTSYSDSAVSAVLLFLTRSAQDMARVEKTKDRLVKEQDQLVEIVTALKQKPELNPYDRYQLKKALAEGEETSAQIARFDALLQKYDSTNQARHRELSGLMSVELMQTVDRLLRTNKSTLDSGVLKLLVMMEEKNRYDELRPFVAVDPIDFSIQRGDDATMIARKADYLMDQADRLKSYLGSLEETLQQLRRRKSLDILLSRVAARSEFFRTRWPSAPNFDQRLPLTRISLSTEESLSILEAKIGLEIKAALARIYRFEHSAAEMMVMAKLNEGR